MCAKTRSPPRSATRAFRRSTAREFETHVDRGVAAVGRRARRRRATRRISSRRLRPGVDGVIVQHGAQRATFLPQVWDDDRRSARVPRGAEAQGRAAGGFLEPAAERFALHGDEVGGARVPVERRAAMTRTHPGRWWHRACRRAHPVRPLPARLPAARRAARRLLRAPARGRRDGAHDLRPLVGLLHRSDREEAAQPLLSRARRCSRSAPPAATSRASSARTGTSRSRARWTR